MSDKVQTPPEAQAYEPPARPPAQTPPKSPTDQALDQLRTANGHLAKLCAALGVERTPAELANLNFDGKAGLVEVVDDVGAPGLSYAVYNVSEVAVFVSFGGGPARPGGGALEVPARHLVVFPFAISGHIRLGVDPVEIGEDKALVHRARFHTVQPFFIGAL